MLRIFKTAFLSHCSKYLGDLQYINGKHKERLRLFSSDIDGVLKFIVQESYVVISPDDLKFLQILIDQANKNELMMSDYSHYKKRFPVKLHLFLLEYVEWHHKPIVVLEKDLIMNQRRKSNIFESSDISNRDYGHSNNAQSMIEYTPPMDYSSTDVGTSSSDSSSSFDFGGGDTGGGGAGGGY